MKQDSLEKQQSTNILSLMINKFHFWTLNYPWNSSTPNHAKAD